jgi:isopentenyldiphosphate isomerase
MNHKIEKRQKRPLGRRHEANCRVCSHPQREEIESEWIEWAQTSKLAQEHGISRDSLYRHCHALGLFEKRRRNLRAALERIVERADSVEVSASSVVAAATALAKINNSGQWVDKIEQVNLNELFDRMTAQELETYAKTGDLPEWFRQTVGATPSDSHEDSTND